LIDKWNARYESYKILTQNKTQMHTNKPMCD
jgi:hypothetical protein